MKVLNEFKTHYYYQDFKKTSLFCPNCGKQEIWVETGDGDLYVGPQHLCCSCNYSFNFLESLLGDNYVKIVEQIKSGIIAVPKTPKGN